MLTSDLRVLSDSPTPVPVQPSDEKYFPPEAIKVLQMLLPPRLEILEPLYCMVVVENSIFKSNLKFRKKQVKLRPASIIP